MTVYNLFSVHCTKPCAALRVWLDNGEDYICTSNAKFTCMIIMSKIVSLYKVPLKFHKKQALSKDWSP